jgi:hypothetical protein
MQAITDGIQFWVRADGKQEGPMSKVAAVRTLILKHGLTQEPAEGLLKGAKLNNSPHFIIKYGQGAYGDYYEPSQPMAPSIPEPMMGVDPSLQVPVQYPQEEQINANPGLDPRFGTNYMDMQAGYEAQRAADSGQKEVLDTSVISGLIKTVDPETSIDKWVGDLMLGLDRVGRILFMYYWHFEQFKERFGSQDMPELQDNHSLVRTQRLR